MTKRKIKKEIVLPINTIVTIINNPHNYGKEAGKKLTITKHIPWESKLDGGYELDKNMGVTYLNTDFEEFELPKPSEVENKYPTYSDKTYKGHNSERIDYFNNQLKGFGKSIEKVKKEIEKIQNNCVHKYMFECRGMYNNNYKCCLCGHDIEK